MVRPDHNTYDFTRVAKALKAQRTGWDIHANPLKAFATSNNLAIPTELFNLNLWL